MLTAYDYATALILDESGIDAILVGDSCANVFAGESSTVFMSFSEMRYHVRIVSRAVKKATLVADMPFMSHRSGSDTALRHAGILLQAGADAVKLEGAGEVVGMVSRMVELGIPVMGHLGLKPQSVRQSGGYKMYGKTDAEVDRLLADAKELEEAGIFGIVLELIPPEVGRLVSEALTIPTIGIGAGPHTDGQILVVNDMLGLTTGKVPKFARKYTDLQESMSKAFRDYTADVKAGKFPQSDG